MVDQYYKSSLPENGGWSSFFVYHPTSNPFLLCASSWLSPFQHPHLPTTISSIKPNSLAPLLWTKQTSFTSVHSDKAAVDTIGPDPLP